MRITLLGSLRKDLSCKEGFLNDADGSMCYEPRVL